MSTVKHLLHVNGCFGLPGLLAPGVFGPPVPEHSNGFQPLLRSKPSDFAGGG